MAYITFDRETLVNLSDSLKKEYLEVAPNGAFATQSVVGMNTRKYHGLYITPQVQKDDEQHLLLSSLDEVVLCQESVCHLGMHKYPNQVYEPKGYAYLRSFAIDPVPTFTYRIGNTLLQKQLLFLSGTNHLVIKYTVLETIDKIDLQLQPFLAFRNVHHLCRKNDAINTQTLPAENGRAFQLYQGYTPLYIQASKAMKYYEEGDWYYNINYPEEEERGYDASEDLYVAGYFETTLRTGDSLYVSVGITPIDTATLAKAYEKQLKQTAPRTNFDECLTYAASQFVVKNNNKTAVVAGYPWFGRWGRDTFISLPGLTLACNNPKQCEEVINTMLSELNGALFPNIGSDEGAAYNSVDAPLWFFHALQCYAEYTKPKGLWKKYGKQLADILNGFRSGTIYNIHMEDSGLIYAGAEGKALTWMDAVVGNTPVTPRIGMPVEINALWYNAVMFSIELARLDGDKDFVAEWQPIAEKIAVSFKETFWSKEKGYLADCVNGTYKDWSIRPNMIYAVSLPYAVISEKVGALVLETVKHHLLTPRGLRTLSPIAEEYKGRCAGDQATRDYAYHQGTIWPWLLEAFVEGYLKIHQKSGLELAKRIYAEFEETMFEHGVGSVSEIYDGEPPFEARGTIAQAWSVAALLRIRQFIQTYEIK